MYKIETGHKMPKVRRAAGSMPKLVADAVEKYNAAYKAVYGVAAPVVEYREGFVYIGDAVCGISPSIFRNRIKQLQYRKG